MHIHLFPSVSVSASISISISLPLLLLITACTTLQPIPDPTAAPTLSPTESPLAPAATIPPPTLIPAPTNTPIPTAEPTIPLPQTVAEAQTDGVSFFYDDTLFSGYTIEKIPAVAGSYSFVDGPPLFYYDVPDFIRFQLETDTAATRPTLLLIQPIRSADGEIFPSYTAQDFDYEYQRFAALETLLNTGEGDPYARGLRGAGLAHRQRVDFSNGRGLRYLGLIPDGPGLTTATNEELYYIYEGVSDDGRYYIWLQYPVATDTLPHDAALDLATVEAINAGDTAAWLTEQMEMLDKLPHSTFAPDLRRLDLMLETLFVAPDASTVTSIPSNDPSCTNDAQFVTDVTIPDGTPIEPRTTFTKTWRLRNTGTCTWSAAYTLARPASFSPPNVTPIRVDSPQIPVVAPGEEAEISVTLLAPPIPGYFRSEWQLYPPFDFEFGPPPEGFGPAVYTEITVNRPAEVTLPSGIWEITAVTGDSVPYGLSEELIGQTVIFEANAITFEDQTCTDVTYSGRFAYGGELREFNDLIPEEITNSGRSYLELIRTTCDLPYFDQFIRQNTPANSELLIRYDDSYFIRLRPR